MSTGQPQQATPRRLSPAKVNTIVAQFAKEVQRYRIGTIADRDELAQVGSQFLHLGLILGVLTKAPEEREKGLTMLRKTLRQQPEPGEAATPIGGQALQLTRALVPYLNTTRRQRALLINSVGRCLYQVHRGIVVLTEPDRERREQWVERNRRTELELPQDFVKSLKEIYQYARWKH